MQQEIASALNLGGTVVAKMWYTDDPIIYLRKINNEVYMREIQEIDFKPMPEGRERTVEEVSSTLAISSEHPDLEIRVLAFKPDADRVLAEGSVAYNCRCGCSWDTTTKDGMSFLPERCPECKEQVLPSHVSLSRVPNSLDLPNMEKKAFLFMLNSARVGRPVFYSESLFNKYKNKFVSKKNAWKTISNLVNKGLIEKKDIGYELTEKGREYL